MDSSINIVQWNSRSLISNKVFLDNYLQSKRVDILAISETWCKPSNSIRCSGYNIQRFDRIDGKGGVAIMIKHNYCFQPIKLDDSKIPNIEITAIRIHLPKQSISLISVYCPPSKKVETEALNSIFDQVPPPYMMCGDLNAHHICWGSGKTNESGDTMLKFLDEKNLVIVNNGKPTRSKLIRHR